MPEGVSAISEVRLVSSFVVSVVGLATILLLETTPEGSWGSVLSVFVVLVVAGLALLSLQVVVRGEPVFGDDGWWVVSIAAVAGVGTYASMNVETPVDTAVVAGAGLTAAAVAGVYGAYR